MSHVVLSPLGLGLLLGLIRWGLLRLQCPQAARLMWLPMGLCLVLLTPLGANALVRLLEGPRQPPPVCAHDPQRPLVLLTGGLDRPAASLTDFAALTPTTLHRTFELYASGLVHPLRPLLITGGGTTSSLSESRISQALLVRLGVEAASIRLDERANSTFENAREAARLLMPASPRIALVTSALHMRRAQYAFASEGFDVCPVPVDWLYSPPSGLGYFLPQSSALNKSERAIHEGVGALVYRIRDALRPDASRAGRGS